MQKHKAKVRSYIEQNLMFADEVVRFQDSDNIFESGFVDSLFAVQLIDYISQEFSIEVLDDDLEIENFSSVQNICNLIDRYNAQKT